MEVVIQGTISALGFQENGIYYQEPDCYETIRDLIRFLRNDTSVLLARRICGERNIIGNDLIPIIKSENLDGKVFDVALRLLVNLTQPAVVSLQGKQPESTEEWQRFWVLEENLKKAKSAFADTQLFLVLKQRLENYFMETVWEDRLEEDRLVMERIIVLLRYVFAISHTEGDEKRTATESNCHDRVVNAFLDSGIQKVLVHIALQSKEREFHLSILAIFSLIIKEHNPADIVVAGRTRNISEKEKAEEDLRHIVEVEQARLTMQRKRLLANRHPMFSGSYVVKGIPALNKNRDLIVNKPIKSLGELSFLDERKAKKAIAKNRRPFEGVMRTHLSSVDLRLKLKSFIEEILLSCFNCLYKSTKDLAFDLRLSAGQRDSDLHFFFLIKFLLEYTRLAERSSTEVSVCLSIEAFHHIQVQLCNYMESAATLKREAKQYGIRAQYSLSAYKELVLFLQYLIDKGSPDEKDNAQRISFHILIVEEYREMGLSMIRKFSTTFLSKTFLRELVLSNHYYLRLLENAVKTGQLNTVKKRSKIRRKIRRSRKDSVAPESLLAVVDNLSSEDLSLKWSSITDQIKDIILGNMESSTDQIPINSLLDVQEEQHQKFAMLKVQRAMREGRAQDAMGLYRASRELWPTDGIFGDPDSNAEDQLAEIREIFFTDLKDVANELLNVELATQKKFTSDSMLEGNEEDYSSEEEEDECRFTTKEVNFDFPQYVAKFAKADVLRWYVFLLNDFLTNSVELNKALVKFLHRVSFDLNMPSRLFQLSLFRIFSQLRKYFNTLSKEKMKTSSLYQLFNFGYHLLRKFFACYSNLGDRLAPEVLFWKGHKECYEIQNGYGTYDSVKNVEDSTSLWTEELEIELRSLYNEYRDMDERPEGMDILDFIEPNLSRPRTRKQIFKKLKEFALDPLGAKVNKGSLIDRSFPIKQMKELVEEYRSVEENKEDIVDFLRNRLIGNQGEKFSRKRIIKQLNHHGIIYESKKSVKKSRFSEELRTELKLLKQQYDEMDEDDHRLIDLVDYVMRRLSERRSRREIERELRILGAFIEPRNKNSAREKNQFEENKIDENDENSVYERSEEDDGEMALDDTIGENCNVGEINVKSSTEASSKNEDINSPSESTERRVPKNMTTVNKGVDFEMKNKQTSSSLPSFSSENKKLQSSPVDDLRNREEVHSSIESAHNRKRILSTSDDDDFEFDSVNDETPPHQSPSFSKKNKRKRIVLSDSEED